MDTLKKGMQDKIKKCGFLQSAGKWCVEDALGEASEDPTVDLQAAYEKAVQTAKEYGAPDPEQAEPVKEAGAAYEACKNTAAAEADVYDHLYRFFERYYDAGDFISLRYYTRETSGKAAPYAIPYNGEEVKLHWANADQYYIKSAEYFTRFTVDLVQAAEIRIAKFKRIKDPELPSAKDWHQATRLTVDGSIRQDAGGPWWFRKIEGRVPRDPANPGNGQMENVLIVWRNLTGDLEKDNLMLDEWFEKNRISPRDFEFDTIYVNGSNNLPNLRRENENWKVCLIEETFFKRMWHVEGI